MRKSFTATVLMLLTALLCLSGSAYAQKKSKKKASAQAKSGVMPAWEKGYLDIHFISTVTGESTFIIMPDGTQMLVDMAGALHGPEDPMFMPWRPDDSRRPGEWINRYISRCMQWTGNSTIDYVSVTHFHGDHMGSYKPDLPQSSNGDYQMISFADVLDGNKVGMLVDRGWPDYSYPLDMTGSKSMQCYHKCVKYHMQNGMQVERFKTGYDDQFVMKYDAQAYPDFKIMNIAANCAVWTGNGHETYSAVPEHSLLSGKGASKDMCPSENAVSTVFKLSYGDFDYYGGGDVTHNGRKYYAWKDIETPIANVVGEVEVMKSDHHGSSDSNHDYFVRTLSPQAVILTVWRNVQPKGGLQKYLNDNVNGGMTDLFSTSLDMGLEEKLGSGAARILSKEGHLVVRVNPGGESYYIYSLSDKDESMNINERFGPYKSR